MRKLFVLLIVILCMVSAAIAAESAQKLYLSASSAERAGDTAKAMSLYEEIVKRYPDSPLAIKASDKLVENKKAYDASVEASRSEQRRAANAAAEAKRQEQQKETDYHVNARRQGEVQRQQDLRQCDAEKNQCTQNCSLRYKIYDERYSSCAAGCGSDRCRQLLF